VYGILLMMMITNDTSPCTPPISYTYITYLIYEYTYIHMRVMRSCRPQRGGRAAGPLPSVEELVGTGQERGGMGDDGCVYIQGKLDTCMHAWEFPKDPACMQGIIIYIDLNIPVEQTKSCSLTWYLNELFTSN
jgi:hypothetical protein